MSFFQWNMRFKLGVVAMDDEHKELIHIMNNLFELNAQKAPKPEIKQVFKTLCDFTVKHFSDEEAYMKSINFPDLEIHRLVHQDLLTKVNHHFQAFVQGGEQVDQSVFDFLNLWLRAHIMGIDMKYADFSRQGKKAV